MNLQVTLGDLIVAGTMAVTVIGTYFAVRGEITAFRLLLASFEGRMNNHAGRLREHTRSISFHDRKIAAVEGRIFGRRIEDQLPPADAIIDDGL
jgi:hypothetical protein